MRLPCRLREFRGKTGLRQMEERTEAEGLRIHRGTLSQIERGERLPRREMVPVLERAYGRPVSDWYERQPMLVVDLEGAA